MNRMITLNGRDYPLRYTVNALCCLEEKTGRGLEQLMNCQLSGIRALLWCGLMTAENPPTMEEAGEMLQAHLSHGGSLRAVSEALAEALKEAGFFPAPGRERAKP